MWCMRVSLVKCIKVLGSSKKKIANIGDVVYSIY